MKKYYVDAKNKDALRNINIFNEKCKTANCKNKYEPH
jgi:hypothetical protein